MSEKELLLLSNYVYLDASADPLSIGESIDRFKNAAGGFDEKSVAAAGVGGGMSLKEAANLLTEIDRMPETFKALYPERIRNDPDLRGICFGNGNKGEGTVVFRGTGGTYRAWHDNVEGEYLPDTEIQKRAGDFVRNECGSYVNLTVTGHSKGGNLAMYTTVVCPEQVGSCVSYDGQGFSRSFIDAHAGEIAAASGKIKSISAYNDYVNILLCSIAGSVWYAQNQASGADAHSSYHLYFDNRYDEAGNLISRRLQSPLLAGLKQMTDELTAVMDLMPEEGNRRVSDLLAALVAAVITEDAGEDYEKEQILHSRDDLGEYLLSLLPGRKNTSSEIVLTTLHHALTHEAMENAVEVLQEEQYRMLSLTERIGSLSEGFGENSTLKFYVNLSLEHTADKLRKQACGLRVYSSTLEDILRLYGDKEKELTEIQSST